MAKGQKKKPPRQVRIAESAVLKAIELKAPGQSIGGFFEQLLNEKINGLSNSLPVSK